MSIVNERIAHIGQTMTMDLFNRHGHEFFAVHVCLNAVAGAEHRPIVNPNSKIHTHTCLINT